MTQAQFLKSGITAAMVLFAASSFAGPTVLDFSDLKPIGGSKVNKISEDDYTIFNDCKNQNACFKGGKDSLRADVGGTWTTLTKDGGKLFNLISIDLDDLYSEQFFGLFSDYTIDFTFKHLTGKDTKRTVVLDKTKGYQPITLNETNLVSASWKSDFYVRFDNIATSAVPEPSTLALLPLALGGVFFASRRRKAAAK